MDVVRTNFRYCVALLLLLGAGCSGGISPSESLPSPTAVQALPVSPTEAALTATQGVTQPTTEAAETQASPLPSATVAIDLPVVTSGPDCLGDEINPIASAIAADYPFTSDAEVMTWFCNGAEFEDILSALMTEHLTGTPAEESLQMLADGFTWDEIWQLIGLTE